MELGPLNFNVILMKEGMDTMLMTVTFDLAPLFHYLFSGSDPYVKWPDLEGCSTMMKHRWATLENMIFYPCDAYMNGYPKLHPYEDIIDWHAADIADMNKLPQYHKLWPKKDQLVPKDSKEWKNLQSAMKDFIEDLPSDSKMDYRLKFKPKKGKKMTETM